MNEPSIDHLIDRQIDEHYEEEPEEEQEPDTFFADEREEPSDWEYEAAERDMAYGSYDSYQRMP